MLTRTKPDWYAHSWIFYLSQFGMPTTVLGVKFGVPTAQLTGCGKSTGICTPRSRRDSRLSLVVFLIALRHSRFPFKTVVPESPTVCAVIRNIVRSGFYPFESVI